MRSSFSVAELVLESGQPLPALVHGRWASTRAWVQVLPTARAQPAAVVPADHPPGHGEQQLLPHRGAEVKRPATGTGSAARRRGPRTGDHSLRAGPAFRPDHGRAPAGRPVT